jgi:uncharacterized NAD-dependent epimerase/dehydratase family protein
MQVAKPYLLFLGNAADALAAKTARGIADWRAEDCVGQLRLPGCRDDLGLPELTPREAAELGARTMVIGVVNPGGVLPEHWTHTLVEALAAGLDIASGMHVALASLPALASAAEAHGGRLLDVRRPDRSFEVGSGRPRRGHRILTVGTDCSVGKKYTALALTRELTERGVDATFRATGQTGILIAGEGVAIDAVVADFASGAAEWLSPDAEPEHWDVIEGQGSLFHPAFAAVSLGLLHGSQPEAFVVCHEPTRTSMRGLERALPSLQECVETTIAHGRLTSPEVRCAGFSVNTSALAAEDRTQLLDHIGSETGLPAVDPVATGVAAVVDELLRYGCDDT